MRRVSEIALAQGMPLCFCDKARPWQRPSNENTVAALPVLPEGHCLRGIAPTSWWRWLPSSAIAHARHWTGKLPTVRLGERGKPWEARYELGWSVNSVPVSCSVGTRVRISIAALDLGCRH
jgi:hypothetical protein